MEVKEDVVGAGDILDLTVTPSQKEKGQKSVGDLELFLEKILKDSVMQRSGGKIWVMCMFVNGSNRCFLVSFDYSRVQKYRKQLI